MGNLPLFPQQASTVAGRVDTLFFALIGLSLLFAVPVLVLIIYFGIRYRRGSHADRSNPPHGHLGLELAWIIIPLMLSLGIFVWAAGLYFDMARPPAAAIEIDAVGKQWMWKFQHPDGQREINELHVPLGRPIKLVMASQDVIHSLYVPAFRIKQDVLPGRYTVTWFQPTKVGEFRLHCAEFCGTQHATMGGRVVVMDPADYAAWLAQQDPDQTAAMAGAALFRQYGCSGCHGASATVHAPKLEGIFSKPVPLQGDGTVIADEQYIRDSVLLPQKQIAAGYPPIMPSFQGQISEEDLLQIIAYIKSLSTTQNTGGQP